MSDTRYMPPPARWSAYWRLMRFDRPIGILLLLWPTYWALWIAGAGNPSWTNLLIFTAGVVVMRAAGCVMNDIADRDFDLHVERTRSRPLAAGELRTRDAAVLLAVLLAVALGLVLLTNRLTVMLALAGAALALGYPFFKRVTHLPQVVLGIAFGWGIPMAFAAELNAVPSVAWWLLALNIVWAVIYDTLYAMVDRDDDLVIGLKSTAILFGRADLAVLWVLMAAMIALLVWIGVAQGFGWPWFAGVAGAAVLFAHQQWTIRERDRAACFRAFLGNNWVGFAIFAGLVFQYLLP